MSDYFFLVRNLATDLKSRLQKSFPDARYIFVANPVAGSSTLRTQALSACTECAGSGAETRPEPPEILWTEYPGHARELARGILQRSDGRTRIIVVSIGGDGTHNELLSAAVQRKNGQSDPEKSRNIAFLRVPFGSGNDSADAPDLAGLYQRIDGLQTIGDAPAVLVTTRKREFLSFNIASIGIDAFITATRERFRSFLPGNSYRLLADASILFYEQFVRLKRSRFVVGDESWEQDAMLIAFGAGGRRTYGGHLKVLPGRENLCIINRGGLVTKLRMKKLFYEGRHTAQPLTRMFDTQAFEFHYPGKLHLQVDGEPVLLTRDEFPVRFEVIPRAVQVVVPARFAG